MKKFKNLIGFFLILLLSITIFSFDKPIYAETFYKYDIEVKLRNDGTAEFTSYIDLEPTRGTEYYFPVENLGSSEIKNFRVFEMREGGYEEYTFVDNWNIKASREEKANKNGLIKTSNGYELAFGIGDYTRKTFMLKYEVTDFVKKLNDSDMIFWRFVNDKMSAAPKYVKISIESYDGYITDKNAKIWGFGTKGEVKFLNNRIEFKSLESLSKSNYVTILAKIDKGLFVDGERINKNFDEYKEKAFKDSSYRNSFNKNEGIIGRLIAIIYEGKYIFGGIAAYFMFLTIVSKRYRGLYKKGSLKGQYYRQIPEKEWWKLSFVLEEANFGDVNSIMRGFFGLWIQKGMLNPVMYEEGTFIKKEKSVLRLDLSKIYYESDVEQHLFEMVIEAAGENEILEESELYNYMFKYENAVKFFEVKNELEDIAKQYVIEKDYLKLGFGDRVTRRFNRKGKEFSANLVKYYNYLNDFTILDERELIEIRVWKDLLIYAILFELAETVKERLKKLSPDVLSIIEENIGYNCSTISDTIVYSKTFSNSFISAYDSAIIISSSGSGGYTSTGGGGGSFGGGSGGGSR